MSPTYARPTDERIRLKSLIGHKLGSIPPPWNSGSPPSEEFGTRTFSILYTPTEKNDSHLDLNQSVLARSVFKHGPASKAFSPPDQILIQGFWL